MNSTDTTTVGTTVTSPAAGACAVPVIDVLGAMATSGAPSTTTGLPFAGMAVRLRGSKAAEGRFAATGVLNGAGALPTVQTDAEWTATPGGYAEHTSSTPGDLSPGGPLS